MTTSDGKELRPVLGLDNYFVSRDGELFSNKVGGRLKPMKTFLNHGLYPDVKLKSNGRYHHRKIHRIVLEAFVGPKPEGMEARHLDGNPQNNRVDNLKWGTRIENNNDQITHGTAYVARGERHKKAKLTEADVVRIRSATASMKELAEHYGLNYTYIYRVKNGISWRHIP